MNDKRLFRPENWAVGFFFLLLLAAMGIASHLVYNPQRHHLSWEPPHAVSGDEPHYLMAVKSILFDHDIQFQEDYRRPEYQGLEHHTILVDPVTGEHEWAVLYDPRHPSMQGRKVVYCKPWDCPDPKRMDPRFPDPSRIVERSAHPLAFPAMVATLLAPTRPKPAQVEGRMQAIMLVASWLTSIFLYRIARGAGLTRGASLAAVALLVFASPWLAYSRSIYSETFSGFFLILGLRGMQSRRPLVSALAVVAATAIKPPFILMGMGWIIERLISRQYRESLILGLVLGLGGLSLILFNEWQANTALIAGHLKGEQVWSVPNPLRTLLNPWWGLLVFAPWTVVALCAAVRSLRGFNDSLGLLRMIALPTLLYWTLLSFNKYFGQSCFGPRYWVPLLPWFALAAVLFASQSGRIVRTVTLLLAEVSVFIAVPGALSYPFMFDRKPFEAFRAMISFLF